MLITKKGKKKSSSLTKTFLGQFSNSSSVQSRPYSVHTLNLSMLICAVEVSLVCRGQSFPTPLAQEWKEFVIRQQTAKDLSPLSRQQVYTKSCMKIFLPLPLSLCISQRTCKWLILNYLDKITHLHCSACFTSWLSENKQDIIAGV